MKHPSIPSIFCFVLAACHSHGPGGDHAHDEHGGHADHGDHGHGGSGDERPALSFTDWASGSELFVELPALVRGEDSPCAAHVTKLDGFAALAAGRVTAVLRGEGAEERFEVAAPSVPGIFRPVVKPASAGKRRLVFEVRAEGLSADHDVGEVVVFESAAAAKAGLPEEPEAPGRVPFLKEQQWVMAFGTAPAAVRPMRPSLGAPAAVRPRADGDVVVRASTAGRVATRGRVFPRLGQKVGVGDVLAVLAPRLESADIASLELAVKSAELEQQYAARERERLGALAAEGAVPERRLAEAALAVKTAEATLDAARRRLDQFQRVSETQARGEAVLEVRAPLAGHVTEVFTAPGSFVEVGAPLFRVTDTTQVWIEAAIAEIDVPRLGTPRAAEFRVDGLTEPIVLGPEALVARGQLVDPVSRTLTVAYAADNAGGRVPVGAFARARIATDDERPALAVADSALVDDGGTTVVFVQVEGEAFERRVVRLGLRDRGFVEVLSGVADGEWVVTRGAWSVKLAASSGTIPAHGHAH